MRDLDDAFLSNMFRGRVYLQISSNDSPRGELRSQIKIKDDGPCTPPITGLTGQACVSEGHTYFNGEAWTPDYDRKCTTCSCKVSAHVQRIMMQFFVGSRHLPSQADKQKITENHSSVIMT